MATNEPTGHTLAADRLADALNSGAGVAPADPGAVEAYLSGVEAAIDARVDARVAQRLGRGGRPAISRTVSFTSRAVGSLAVGIPLTAVSGAIAGGGGSGVGAILGVLGALTAIVTLNIYFTEVEKDLEKERIRASRP
jgi:hypothetical protein